MLLTTKVFHVFTVPNGSSVNTVKRREGGERVAMHFIGLWRMRALVIMPHGSLLLLG